LVVTQGDAAASGGQQEEGKNFFSYKLKASPGIVKR